MKSNSLRLAILALAASCAQGMAAGNIVQNGDFSSNASSYVSLGYTGQYGSPATIPGFDLTNFNGGLGGTGTQAYENFQPASYFSAGDPAVYLFEQNNGSSVDSVSQMLTLAPLTIYSYSFMGGSRSGYGAANGAFAVTDGGILLGMPTMTFTTTGQSDFASFSGTFTTGTNVSNAKLILSNTTSVSGDHTVDFGDVSITATGVVPEPSSYALLGIGVAALLLVARRSGLKI